MNVLSLFGGMEVFREALKEIGTEIGYYYSSEIYEPAIRVANRKTDLLYKIELQKKLESILTDEFYTIEELIELLGLKEQQAYKAFRKVNQHRLGMRVDDVIFRLMGNRFYT